MREDISKNNGITLVSLVITIIILLILAGITISQLIGNGIIEKAKHAKDESIKAQIKEEIYIKIYTVQMDNKGEITEEELNEIFSNYDKDKEIKTNIDNEKYIETKEGYQIKISEIYGGNISTGKGGVEVKEIFDKTGEEEGKLHIGDFINYTAGDWTQSDYYKAQSATTLTKIKLDQWFTKYKNIENADTYGSTFLTIYNTKYETLIDNSSSYWLSQSHNPIVFWCVLSSYPSGSGVSGASANNNIALGIRVLVSLSNTVKLSEESVETKIITSRNVDYTYNVWDLL